jgi:hypothetical protein
MACRGVHFALTPDQEAKLRSLGDDEDGAIEFIKEEVETTWDTEWLFESDKSWDAIHRCLTDGNLELENGSPPLNLVIFGGEQFCSSGDYYICLVAKSKVPAVATALSLFSRAQFEKAYASLANTNYDGPHDDDDREYTWENIQGLKPFFEKAAAAGRSVVFTVDQ